MDPGLSFYKEVYISKSTGNWKEITLNTEGIPGTLQDIETQQRSGGYAYKNHSNRFIYWRTVHDVLELVEESLDVNLCNNQIRYTFTDSPILEWVTIVESYNSVVLLVPTVCSVHRLTFPHPDIFNKKGNRSGNAYSIFHGASESEALNSNTYHVLSNIPSGVVSGACCLNRSDEAVFAFSLKNSHIMVITMEPCTGAVTTTSFSRSSMVPWLIYGLSSVITGKEVNSRYVGTSMVFHYIHDSLYLFILDVEGEIRGWCCDNSTNTSIQVFKPSELSRNNSKLCKGVSPNGDLLLCAYHQSEIALVRVRPEGNGIHFTVHGSPVSTSKSETLLDMIMGDGYEVWCSFTTGQDCPVVTRLDLSLDFDSSSRRDMRRQVLLTKPSQFEYPSDIVLDPAQLYLDKIMNCGFSSTPDLARTLSALKSERRILNNYDLRKQISAIIDAEISAETADMEMDDTDFLIVSERSWCRLYRCCVQYLSTGLAVSGLIRLPSSNSLVLIKPHGYSLARNLTPLELVSSNPDMPLTVSAPMYSSFIQAMKKYNLEKVTDKVELALHLGDYLDRYIEESSSEIKFQYRDSKSGLDESLYELLKELHAPDDVSKLEDTGGFSSEAGISAVCTFFQELVTLRLKMCECVCIALQILPEKGFNKNYIQLFQEMTSVYKVLVWTCQSPVVGHPSIIHSFLTTHPNIGRDNLLDTVQLLLHAVWPINNSEVLANHLLNLKRYDLLQMYAHFVDYSSWRLILAQSYLASGEPHKAFNLFAVDNQQMSLNLKAISLFELYSYPDYVIAMVESNLAMDNLSPADIDTLYSLKFVQELKLGHYTLAYACIEALPNLQKKSDFLLRLVLELINSHRYDMLTSFSFRGLQEQLEKILVARSRSLEFSKSQVFYTLLYTLHINNKDFKKAASVMYEQALRCESSEAQWKCFNISYNALKLLPPEDAFIVKPSLSSSRSNVEIVDAEEMRKELELAKYRFYLKCSPCDSVGELISSCVAEKLYSKAIKLASLFNLDSSLIIEAFTADVIRLAEPSADYKWLFHNDDDHIELTVNSGNAMKVGWRLLEYIVSNYEKPCETFLLKAIASQVLRMKHHLPIWVINSYKKKNGAELLRIYLFFGDLESASDLAVDYLKAAMGVSSQDFGFSTGIQPSAPSLYTPIYMIDLLLKELKSKKMGEELEYTLNEYVEAAKRVTADKSSMARSAA